MATVSSGKDATIAKKALDDSGGVLKKIDLTEFAHKMLEKVIITDDQKRRIVDDKTNGLDKDQRNNELLNKLKDAVEVDGSIFTWFIEILEGHNVVSQGIAKKLNEKYDELMKSTKKKPCAIQKPQGENVVEETDSAVEPLEWPDNPKKYEKEEVPFTDDLTQDIKFLLMPATPAEEEQVLLYLEPKDESSDKYIKTSVDNIPLYIGKYRETPVIIAKTAPDKDKQGPINATSVATIILTKIKSIEYVVAVGVCFGINQKKQQLGDVVISSIICDFTCKREGTTVHPRGAQNAVEDRILDIFRPPYDFEMPHNNNKPITGPIISQPDLIDNAAVKARLVKKREDAIGGEMEGAAIMAVTKRKREPQATCIVIKGIGDWGDGEKEGSKEWKKYAARAAAYYVKAALNKFRSD